MLENSISTSRVVPGGAELGPNQGMNGQNQAIASSLNLAVVFWRRRWVIAGSLILSLTLAFVTLNRSTKLYESSSLLYVHQSTLKYISNESVGSSEAANLFTQCELIKSPVILAGALDRPGVAETKMLHGVDNQVGFLKSIVNAEPGKQGELLKVSIVSTEPADSSVVLNAVVQAYIDYLTNQQKSGAGKALEILTGEKHRYEAELKEISGEILKIEEANSDMNLTSIDGTGKDDPATALSTALAQAHSDAFNLQTDFDEIQTLKDDPQRLWQYISVIQQGKGGGGDPQLASLQTQLTEQLVREREEKHKFGNNADVIQEMDREIADLSAQVAGAQQAAMNNFVAIASLNLQRAKLREQELEKKYKEQRDTTKNLNAVTAQIREKRAVNDRDERMLDTIDTRIKELDLTQLAGGPGGTTATILEAAKPNYSPISPKPAQTMAIGLIVGLMVGLSLALLQDFMDQRLRSAEEISRVLDLPVLGTVPHMNIKGTSPQRGQEVHLRTRSDVSEAYRTIRTAIYFGVPEGSGKTILITSPAPGDGKSTMASNIAIAMAQAGRHVLMIDADCRRPTQHKTFSVQAEVGLSTVLLGRTSFDDAVHKTSTENLDILPCGPLPTNPAELLDSQSFIDLLKSISSKYDNIIIDSPPVVPVTDARIIAASCDVTVLVLRAEKSTRKMTQHANDALAAVGAHVLGVVVNDVPRSQEGYYYYSGYGSYRYGYGYSSNGTSQNGNGTAKEVKAITVTSKVLDI